MIFHGMLKTETLFFHLENDKDELHFIEMERDSEDGVFYVRTCCDDEWEWKFPDVGSNYELVKHAIFDIAFDSHHMGELIDGLDEIFDDIFNEIVVRDYDCDGHCEHCTCKE